MTSPGYERELGDEKPHWTVDRRIPVALLVAMAGYFAGGIWYVSGLSNRVDNLEKFVGVIAESRPVNLNRITILEQQFIAIQQSQARIERTLEKITNK